MYMRFLLHQLCFLVMFFTLLHLIGEIAASSNLQKSPRVRPHSPTDENGEVITKATKRQNDVAHETSDLNSAEMMITSADNSRNHSSASKVVPELQKPEVPTTVSPLPVFLNAVSPSTLDIPSTTEAVSMNSLHVESTTAPMSDVLTYPPNSAISQATETAVNNVFKSDIASATTMKTNSFANISSTMEVKPSQNIDTNNNGYVNLPNATKPAVSPKPLPRKHLHNDVSDFKLNHRDLGQGNIPASSSTLVQNKVFGNKSNAERAKFEETINKALTSLPKLPQMVVKPKVV